jgi:hypothetical protein
MLTMFRYISLEVYLVLSEIFSLNISATQSDNLMFASRCQCYNERSLYHMPLTDSASFDLSNCR